MASELDLATVLLLQKSAYIVGIIGFAYMWHTAGRPAGIIFLVSGFLLMALGSTIAGLGELQLIPARLWMLGSLTMGLFGYALIWVGLKAVSCQRVSRLDYLALIPALLVAVAAFITHFEEVNVHRAATFNGAAALTFLASAGRLSYDGLREPLNARVILIVITSLAALLCGSTAIGFLKPEWMLLDPITVFFYFIMLNFMLVLFIAALLGERAYKKIKLQANTDPLTGISNRRSFFKSFTTQPRRGDAVMLLDLDHFKLINDRFGHLAGDAVLMELSRRVACSIRRTDALARYGGEEFILFLPTSGNELASEIGERIRQVICIDPVHFENQLIKATVSIGIAVAKTGNESLQDLINQADTHLYKAKRYGRNRVEHEGSQEAA